MEGKNSENTETTNAPAVVTENGTSAPQEVTSTTPAEPTKRSLRVQTWKKIQENKCGVGFNAIFNRIPGFIDADKAAKLLASTEDFKKAKNIKVNIDRALHSAKLEVLTANKTLYLPGTRDSRALFLRVDVPADATDDQKKEILHVQDVQQNRAEITLDDKVKLDLIIVGSVVVSRDGYRIGRGNGFTDLDIGLLTEAGAITPETTIATIVHDVQVVDTLPNELFQKFDTPVDLIVTPTEIINVAKRLTRPSGVFWELLSERRLKIVPALQQLKENLEKSGKVVAIKEENTDVEQGQNRNRRRGPQRRRFPRRNNRRAVSQTDNEQQTGQENNNGQQKPKEQQVRQRRNRRYGNNRRRRTTKSEGDQSGVENKSQERERKPQGGRKQRQRPQRDFCIKLTNLTRDIRVKDLKTELRKRKCNPLYISWKGQYGKCYLHFGNRNGTPTTEEDINKVLESLENLSLTITTGGGDAKDAKSDAAAGDAKTSGDEKPADVDGETKEGEGETEVKTEVKPETKTINVNVELVKFTEKKEGEVQTNGDDKQAADGDATTAARIESVDTTTV